MKPKTKLQIEVFRLHKKLSEPYEHESFIAKKHDLYYTTHYKNIVCLECNHTWKPDLEFWKEEMVGVQCPSCQRNLKKTMIHNGLFEKVITYADAHVVDRFQVIRYFSCWKIMNKTEKPRYHYRSLFEEWTEYEKKKKVIVGRTITWTGDGFSSSDYEVRANSSSNWKNNEFDRFASDYNCPKPNFLPRFQKYGLSTDFHNCDYRCLLRKLEASPKVETLFKAKEKDLLFHAVHKDERYYEFWPQIKIALRNKYKISDPGIWYDYLELLKEFRKDILSPKFILPKNIKAAHNEYVAKKQKKLAIIAAEREVRRQENERAICEAEEALKDVKVKLFRNFKFKKGSIEIVTLIDEADVKKEGEILKHCVYANAYHKKAGILLMSARIKGKPIETIEISLATYKIIQSRGKDNTSTAYHDEIIEIIKSNMIKISKIVEKHKKLKNLDSKLKNLQNAEAA